MPQHRSDAEIADAVDWPGNIPGQSVFMSAEPAQSSTQISKEVIIKMKVVKNDNKNKNEKNPLTLAEMEACQQFEASDRAGQALFHPRVAAAEVREELSCVRWSTSPIRKSITPSRMPSGWAHSASTP